MNGRERKGKGKKRKKEGKEEKGEGERGGRKRSGGGCVMAFGGMDTPARTTTSVNLTLSVGYRLSRARFKKL